MKGNSTVNMTHGNPTGLLLRFAIPMLIGNIFQQLYTLADSVIVGQFLGANALAAIGSTGSVTYLFFSVCNGISSGSSVVTSQYFGAGDDANTKRAIANAAYIMFTTALVMGIAAYLAAPGLLALMATPIEIRADATLYMRMSCIGVPLVAVYNYASSMLRALGDSKTPLYFLIFSCILNIVLDIFCVYNLGLGIFGAALATIIAQVVSGVGCLLYALRTNPYFKLTKEDMRPDKQVIGKSVKLGLPMALQWSLIAISTTALQAFVNTFGTAVMAAFTTTNRIEGLVHMPYGSISAALATYAGQNYGAGDMKRVKEGLKNGMFLASPLLMMHLQEHLEHQCWLMAQKTQCAPSQRMADFVSGRHSSSLPATSYTPGVASSPLHEWLPPHISQRLRHAFTVFGSRSRGFLTNEALVIPVESRTSAPVRIVRDSLTLQHISTPGLYPCGEGAGYAGGIVSAAVDGERCAEMLAEEYARMREL